MTVDGRQQLRATASSVLRQLEQPSPSSSEPLTRVQILKLQATLRHARKLVKDLDEQGEPQSTLAPLKQRLLQAESDVTKLTNKNGSTRPSPLGFNANAPAPSTSADLDFLAPSVPLFPTSSISPSSSPAPGAAVGISSPFKHQHSQVPPHSYSPIPFSNPLDSNQYSPYEATATADESITPQWGIDTSVANRNRATSSASRRTDYEPDDYSPSRTRHPENDSHEEGEYRPPASSSFEDDSATGATFSSRRDLGDDDPESGGNGHSHRYGLGDADGQDDDFDPESGAPAPRSRPRSDTKNSTSSRTSSLRQQTMPPPPPRKSSTSSASNRDQLLGAGLRQRPRAGSNLSTHSNGYENDLTSTAAGATTSDLLSHHHDLQNSLMSSLTQLSGQLKTSSLAFQDNLEKDKQVMSDAQTKLEKNHDKIVKQGSRLGVVKKKARGTTCWTIMAITVVLFAWVVMFFLIKVT
ncbi:hypothetical protein ACM66B_000437 [Microbotryomycetes sp. NB124-2]